MKELRQENQRPSLVTFTDPDPYTVASTFITAAAFVLQFVQFWQSRPKGPPSAPSPGHGNIYHLEEACEKSQSQGKRLLRLMEQGSRDVDSEFYDQPYRIGGTMYLETGALLQFRHGLGDLMNVVSHVGMWVNHIIADEPELAARIGARLNDGLDGMVNHLNRILAEGLPNREAVQSAKAVLAALHDAIEKEVHGGN